MNLPPELWIKVSEYLTKKDLKTLLGVSKRFHSLLKSNFYSNIYLKLKTFQTFCQSIFESALQDSDDENFEKYLNDLQVQDALDDFQQILFLIPNQDLQSLLQRITEPLDLNISQESQIQLKPIYSQGYGKYVKCLSIPSDGFNLNYLKIFEFMPNLKKITFYHPPHDEKWIPFLKPKVLNSIASNFQSLHSLIIEDLSKVVLKPLLNILYINGSQLLHLTLEASGELEPFFTTKGVLQTLSKYLPNIKVLRLDGIAAGNDGCTVNLVRNCPKLECIVLDYCFGISMESISIIWNGLNNLKFLGFAGLDGKMKEKLVKNQPKLCTLRFVDCAVSDEMFQNLTHLCPNLEMIRVVFEDPPEFSDYTLRLSDQMIDSFHSCNNLKILAITRCRLMTGNSYAQFLKKGKITTLDLHKDPENSMGELDELFAETVFSCLSSPIAILNLFGQKSLSADFLNYCLISGFFSCIKSLSLNHTQIDQTFLSRVLEFCPKLEYLSIKYCKSITVSCVESFLKNIPSDSNFKKLYALEEGQDFESPYLELNDSWFGEQRLDITSLWEDAIFPL